MINIDFAIKPQEVVPEYVLDNYGCKCLYNQSGEFHSFNDMPSRIWPDGTKEWHKDGIRYRDNDLPAVIYISGDKVWYNSRGSISRIER